MHTVVMPKLGDTMEEGKILQWLKKEGDTVKKGDALAEIETEKVNIEVEAFAAGVLRKILVPAGETVPVGAPIALTGAADEPLPADANTETAIASATTPAGPPSSPERLTHSEGQAGAGPEVILPRPVAQPATSAGHPTPPPPTGPYQPATTGANGYVANGQVAQAAQTQAGGRVFISPLARSIAAEHNLDVTQIPGTGPNGRIIRDDVLAYLNNRQPAQPQVQPQVAPTPAAQPAAPSVPSIPAFAPGEEVRAVPLSAMRKTIARRLQQSMQQAPHFYITMAIDTTRLGQMRAAINEYAAALSEPVKVSYNDLIVKAVATALTRMPQVNVAFDAEHDQLLYKQRINVGMAVALESGLIVPVIRDADKRGILDIAKESRRLSEAARAGKLKPEEFSGGTFTVSNLGMFDVESFTAVINPPEAAILAVGAIAPAPAVENGQVTVRDQLKATLSVDHRALDGATAARFMQEFKRLLEQPVGMFV